MLALSTSRQRDERRIIFCGNRLHPDRVRPTGLGCRGSGYRLADHIGLGSRGASQVMHVPSGPAPRISFKSVRDWERLRARGEGEGIGLSLCVFRGRRVKHDWRATASFCSSDARCLKQFAVMLARLQGCPKEHADAVRKVHPAARDHPPPADRRARRQHVAARPGRHPGTQAQLSGTQRWAATPGGSPPRASL
jgi:hypothetical protein